MIIIVDNCSLQVFFLVFLKDGISVPGSTLRYLFQTLEDNQTYFSLSNEQQKYLHTLLRENMTGRNHLYFIISLPLKDKRRIRNNQNKMAQSVQGFDAIALYLSALMQYMPTDHPIVRRKQDDFQAEQTHPFGKQAREWLEYIAHTQNIYI